jgi:hypothetical protein
MGAMMKSFARMAKSMEKRHFAEDKNDRACAARPLEPLLPIERVNQLEVMMVTMLSLPARVQAAFPAHTMETRRRMASSRPWRSGHGALQPR